MTKNKSAGARPDIQGEGNYDAARRFDKAEEAFVKSGAVEEGARKAADALEGPEAEQLEAARVATAKGAHATGAKSGKPAGEAPR
jgi:hypothetical protein